MSLSSLDQALRRRLVFGLVHAAGILRRLLARSEETYKLLFLPGLEGLRFRFGKWRAWLVFERARRDVPAYRELVAELGDPRVRARGLDPDLSVIPVTTKENYVTRYEIEARCRGGRLPERGAVVDESSGTSGMPNNWVRGAEERAEVRQALQVALHHQFGREPMFVLNAFALGPWATGMNVSMSVVDIAILKSVGPDVAKIENTLRLFGPRYRYLIAGYPPFLKTVVDTADVDWAAYDLIAVYGGEGISEGMRDYLLRQFRGGVYGSYGASDLEINLAAENDFTIGLRRVLAEHEGLRRRLARLDGAGLPLIFQYNPIDYYVESSEEGELVVTVCRARNASPKVRYNIRDLGHVVRFPELRAAFAAEGADLSRLRPRADLPLLFLYGRADAAVPYFGCKITPRDVEQVVFSLPELAARVNSFALLVSEDERATKRIAIAFELREGSAPPPEPEPLRRDLLGALERVNQDYREAARFIPAESVPTLEFHPPGTGPFAGYDVRLKRHYVRRR